MAARKLAFGLGFAALALAGMLLVQSENTLSRTPGAGNMGLMPTNSPAVGDVLMCSDFGQVVWASLTNHVRVWSGTTGNTALGLGTTTFLQPNNSSATLLVSEAAGVTRVPLTRSTTLQNLYVIVTPGPGAGKSTIATVMTNGTASALTATVSGTATNANDTMHFITVPAGTEIGVRIVTTASSVAGKACWSFEGR